MHTPDELLAMVNQILNQVQDDSAALEPWSRTEEGRQVIQFIVQVGKYNTTVGQGQDILIGDHLDRALLEEVRDLLRSQLTPPPPDIDWQQVSRSLLNEQIQRLTTNPLTHAEGIAYRTEQVYVPLGLVERKKVPRRGEEVSPEQGSLLYKETEITRKFEHEDFLEQVLRQGQSPRSGGRRIAVIGEPGAGKTTLLQQMARWVAEHIEGAISIWVSLADLQGRSLEDYLLEQWLPAVVQQQGQAEASTLVKDALVEQFRAGQVWLLLDGVDEMPVAEGNPLGEMERQVRLGGLLAQARIVLTCRLNLWDGDRHALDTFDVYRTLEFAYPTQVEQFIGQWFGALPEAQVGQAERLRGALRQPGKERLQDLVKNPLRLTLLCFNWYLGKGTLPETKAGLYEQFVADFYEWKPEQFPTTAEQRRRLNAALGELAREAIDKEGTRFRLRYDFVCEFLGEPDEPGSLFQLALQFGWLNKVGMDADNPRKAVYAFFHPTFQEYFSALVIDDWHNFLGHIPKHPSNRYTRYRVFEPRWKEVILLWFGRLDIKKELKESFIEALIDFEDECGGFYWHQTYFLAASCLAEFVDSKYISEIVNQVIDWGFGLYTTFLDPINENARAVLARTNRSVLLNTFSNLLDTDLGERELLQMAMRLGEIDPGNLNSINYLIKLINMQEIDEHDRWIAIYQLGKVGEASGNSEAICALTVLLNTIRDDEILWRSATSLVKISPHNPQGIKTLTRLLQSDKDDSIRLAAARNLIQVAPDNPISEETLIDLADNSQDEAIRSSAVLSLKDFRKNVPGASRASKGLLEKYENQYLISLAHDELDEDCSEEYLEKYSEEDNWSLGEIEPTNLDSVNMLLDLVCNNSSRDTIFSAAWSLREINHETFFPRVVTGLKDCIRQQLTEDDFERYRCCYAVVWHCAQNMSYPNFHKAWHQ
ncbi:NACHT domain-containing protein [Nodosilinea sp. PGN35]|uniref:NACHT domain-containing protein n=1 Tax=Nodosilinea sp. PGN35 TaxID=3020489 RepID=UPI0023B292E6|nr:NACHT domain-containing protein [Nodosilinea sp. TSF1-S3]MDF0366106.1 NACHT domain-containing protein [Nodosilinea sp. TSF1-S3]